MGYYPYQPCTRHLYTDIILDIDYDNKISWKEFLSTAYPDEALRNSEDLDYDKKKFNLADMDQDGLLDSKEFGNFYFPGVLFLNFYRRCILFNKTIIECEVDIEIVEIVKARYRG